MKLTLTIALIITMLTMAGCASRQKATVGQTASDETLATTTVHALGTAATPSYYIPNAVIYRTNGDYNNRVMVTLNADGTALTSYPAITDVSAKSEPIDLGDGWLLDRRGGIGKHSAFLEYTYTEYRSLPTQPSASELMQKIIPGASVTEYRELPISINEAFAHPDEVKKFIKCKE